MKILSELAMLNTVSSPVCMAAGVFDGVHRGHRQVLARCLAEARELAGEAWVLTFDTHPMKVLEPANAPFLLTSTEHKLRFLRALGVDGCLLLRFTRTVAEMEPEEFVRSLCASASSLRRILVGQNWRFGKRKRGDAVLLRRLAEKSDVSVTIVDPVVWANEIISSTRIRDSILRGRLKDAAAMLGRTFSILGTVTKGRSIGTRLGFPTANLNPHNEVRPPLGVYAVRVRMDEAEFDGVLNIGVCPTIAEEPDAMPGLELHLPGVAIDLYGRDIEVLFAERLRDEQKFTSVEELRKQIARDIERARSVLEHFTAE